MSLFRKPKISTEKWELDFTGEERFAVVTYRCHCGTLTRWFGGRNGITQTPTPKCCNCPEPYPQRAEFLAHLKTKPTPPEVPSKKTAKPLFQQDNREEFVQYVKADPRF